MFSCSSYFFEAYFQVVLWLLLIVGERFIYQKLLLHMDLESKKNTILSKTFQSSQRQTNRTVNSPVNMVCSDCCQGKLKPLLSRMGSLLDVLLLPFYPPPALLIGQMNYQPALSDQQESSSPGTPSASLAAGKSIRIREEPQNVHVQTAFTYIHICLITDIQFLQS